MGICLLNNRFGQDCFKIKSLDVINKSNFVHILVVKDSFCTLLDLFNVTIERDKHTVMISNTWQSAMGLNIINIFAKYQINQRGCDPSD